MSIKLKNMNLSPDIPKLDLSRSIESEKTQEFVISNNINEFKSLRELFESISYNL